MKYSFRNTGPFAILFSFFMTACVVDAQGEVDSTLLPEEASSPAQRDALSTATHEESETTTPLRPQDESTSRPDSTTDDENDGDPFSVEAEEDSGDDVDGMWACATATMKVALSCGLAIDACLKTQSVDACAEGESEKCMKALETWSEECR